MIVCRLRWISPERAHNIDSGPSGWPIRWGIGCCCHGSAASTGVEVGAYAAADVGRLTLMIGATIQGTAAYIASRRITAPQGEALLDDAIGLLIAGASARR
jgi:hypothetical protein